MAEQQSAAHNIMSIGSCVTALRLHKFVVITYPIREAFCSFEDWESQR